MLITLSLAKVNDALSSNWGTIVVVPSTAGCVTVNNVGPIVVLKRTLISPFFGPGASTTDIAVLGKLSQVQCIVIKLKDTLQVGGPLIGPAVVNSQVASLGFSLPVSLT